MKTTSHKISDSLHLIRLALGGSAPAAKAVERATDHLVVIDCSGSMAGELPRVRKQLKEKLAAILAPKDTVTLIWFSGRGECGVLVEVEPVASLKDLQGVHKAIDRWLAPVGLTGFKEPLEEASKVMDRVRGARKDAVFSLFFMSDGCDNQWPRAEILKTVESLATKCSAATFVEYGYYADRQLLAAMAEKAGGALIFADEFRKYEPVFEASMRKQAVAGKRVEVSVEGDVVHGLVFAIDGDDLLTYAVEGGKVLVKEGLVEVFHLAPEPAKAALAPLIDVSKSASVKGQPHNDADVVGAAYAAASLFAVRMKPDVVYPLLKALGDVSFIEEFGGCFGKQKYSAVMDRLKDACLRPAGRFTAGWDPIRVPADDAFTVLDVLRVLSSDEGARVVLDHPEFSYSKISRSRVDANDALTEAEQQRLAELSALLLTTRSAEKVKQVTDEISALTAKKQAALKFVADDAPDGYPIASLTYNSTRPNISVLVKKEGTVDITDRRASADAGLRTAAKLDKLPAKVPSYIWRNYAIVRDGLVNVEKLPAKVSRQTFDLLSSNNVAMTSKDGGEDIVDVVIDLMSLPIINRQMVKEASASDLFANEWELVQLKARQKVFNTYRKALAPKESKGYGVVYGALAADWLQALGITDYNGFNPPSVLAPSTDFYVGKELSVSLKGYASDPPSVNDVKEKQAKLAAGEKRAKPLSGWSALMAPAIAEAEEFIKSAGKDALVEAWLDGKQKASVAEVRRHVLAKAQQIFVVIVGQVWFKEWPTLDQNTLTIKTKSGLELLGTAEMSEIEIKI